MFESLEKTRSSVLVDHGKDRPPSNVQLRADSADMLESQATINARWTGQLVRQFSLMLAVSTYVTIIKFAALPCLVILMWGLGIATGIAVFTLMREANDRDKLRKNISTVFGWGCGFLVWLLYALDPVVLYWITAAAVLPLIYSVTTQSTHWRLLDRSNSQEAVQRSLPGVTAYGVSTCGLLVAALAMAEVSLLIAPGDVSWLAIGTAFTCAYLFMWALLPDSGTGPLAVFANGIAGVKSYLCYPGHESPFLWTFAPRSPEARRTLLMFVYLLFSASIVHSLLPVLPPVPQLEYPIGHAPVEWQIVLRKAILCVLCPAPLFLAMLAMANGNVMTWTTAPKK